MKRVFLLILALLLTAALFAGCGKTDVSTPTERAGGTTEGSAPSSTLQDTAAAPNSTFADATAAPSSTVSDTTAVASETVAPVDEGPRVAEYPVADAPFNPASTGMTENMLARSVHYEGDVTRLKAKLEQVFDENYQGQTNVFFFGDSISDGSGASGPLSFRKLVAKWFTENAKSETVCQNASIGATDSYLGVHRVDKDVLSKEPDIIFIEFINDLDDDFYKASMESLLRKCLSAPTNPAVVLIEMTAATVRARSPPRQERTGCLSFPITTRSRRRLRRETSVSMRSRATERIPTTSVTPGLRRSSQTFSSK